MADVIGAIGSASSGIFGSGGITGALGDIFGTSESTGGTKTERGAVSKQLKLSPEAVQKIIQDVLGAEDGLASIFAGEQATGLYGSTAAAQEAGDFAAKVIGEIAKLQAKQVESRNLTTTGEETQESGGLLGQIGGLLGL